MCLELSDRSEIWQAPRQQCYRGACQISTQCDNSNYKSRSFETYQDLTIRHLIWYWNGTQVFHEERFQMSVRSQCWEMIDNANISMSPKIKFSTIRVNLIDTSYNENVCVLIIPPPPPWLPILLIHIRSQVKTRQKSKSIFEKIAKNSNFGTLQRILQMTHLLKLLTGNKMCNYNTRSTQKSLVRQQNAWFDTKKARFNTKMPGSTQKCPP